MTNKFTYKTYLPSLDNFYYCHEMSYGQYTDVVKLIQNNDDIQLQTYLTSLVKNLLVDKQVYSKLTRVDLFCLLLNMRIVCVSQQLKLSIKGGDTEDRTAAIDLYDVIDKVFNHPEKCIQQVNINEKCSVLMGSPLKLTHVTSDDILNDTVHKIKLGRKSYDLTKMTINQRQQLLESFSTELFSEIVNNIKRINSNYNIPILEVPDENGELTNFSLELYNNSFFEFIKLIYQGNLHEQLYTRYILAKRLNFQIEYIDSRTPAEVNTYISMYKEELEEERKEHEKQKQKNLMNPQSFAG